MISNTWRGPTTTPGYTPPVPGPIAWFNARQITGVAGGAPLAQWDDLSGNANHVNGGVSPIYTLNASRLATLPGVVFNGTTQYLRNAAITAGGVTAGLTIIVALKMISTPLAFSQCVSMRNAGATGFWELRSAQASSAMQMVSGGGAANEIATSGLMEPSLHYIMIGTHLQSGRTTCQIGNGSATSIPLSAATMNLSDLGIGNRANGSATFWSSTMYEILIYPTVLTTQEKATVVQYLAGDWSIVT